MEFDAISGTEHQLESFQFAIHQDDDIEECKESIRELLQVKFNGEYGNKIVRVQYQRGSKSFLFNAGFEQEMYNDVIDWIDEVYKREYLPLVFMFNNFLSFSGPRG